MNDQQKFIFDRINISHQTAIDLVQRYIDVDSKEHPDEKSAALLCKWMFEQGYNLGLFLSPKYADLYRLYDDDIYFYVSLFSLVEYSFIDDGDMCFCYVNGDAPKVIFNSQYDVTIEDYYTRSTFDCINRFNAFLEEKQLKVPPQSKELQFLPRDVNIFIKAAEHYANMKELNNV